MEVATRYLTRVFDFTWYYTYDRLGQVTSARLLKRETSGSVTELLISVVDNRIAYNKRKEIMLKKVSQYIKSNRGASFTKVTGTEVYRNIETGELLQGDIASELTRLKKFHVRFTLSRNVYTIK